MFRNWKLEIRNSKKGFTLVELIVAMSVFLVAITIAVGAFVRSIRTQRAVNHLLAVNSNTSLTIEQMAREVRSSYRFDLRDSGAGGCVAPQFEEIEFTNSKGNKVSYKLESNVLARRECSGADCSLAVFKPLTASNILVERACFLNTGNLLSNDPWRITLFLRVGSRDSAVSGERLDIQTTLSARILPQDL